MGIEQAAAFDALDDMRAEFVRYCSACGCSEPDWKTADLAAAFAWLKLNPDEPEAVH
jgi:hypothetical protein